MLSAFLNHHGFKDAEIKRLLGNEEPSRREVGALEALAIRDWLERAGYTVKIRKEQSHA